MSNARKTEIRSYGIRVLLSSHPKIRRLKRFHIPSEHGNKLWDSTWLLIDFLSRQKLPEGCGFMDVGCGWGLAGIYCAKKYSAIVTSVDIDPEVFPYLRIQAEANKVGLTVVNKGLGALTDHHLKDVDIMIGADICFSSRIIYTLKRVINKALQTGVGMILVADPGRPPFDLLAESLVKKGVGEILEWATDQPRKIRGYILRIGSVDK